MKTFDIIMTIFTAIFGIFSFWACFRLIKLDENRFKDFAENVEIPDIEIKIEYVKHDDDSDKETKSESPEKETKS